MSAKLKCATCSTPRPPVELDECADCFLARLEKAVERGASAAEPKRTPIAEWWEVWWMKGKSAVRVQRSSGAWPAPEPAPIGYGYARRADALRVVKANRYHRLVHVTRWRRERP